MNTTKKPPMFKAQTRTRSVIEYRDPASPDTLRLIDLPYVASASDLVQDMTIRMIDENRFRLVWVLPDTYATDPFEESGAANGKLFFSAYHRNLTHMCHFNPGEVARHTGTEVSGATDQLEVDPHHQFTHEGKTISLFEIAANRFKDKVNKEPTLLKHLAEEWDADIPEVPNTYAIWLSEHLSEVHQDIDDPTDGYFCEELAREAISLWPQYHKSILDPYVVPYEIRFPNQVYFYGNPHDWGESPFDTEAIWVPCEGARSNLDSLPVERSADHKHTDYQTVRFSEDPDQPGMWLWCLTDSEGRETRCETAFHSKEEAQASALASESWDSKHDRAMNYAEAVMKLFFNWSEGHNYRVFSADGEFIDGKARIGDDDMECSSVTGLEDLEEVKKDALL